MGKLEIYQQINRFVSYVQKKNWSLQLSFFGEYVKDEKGMVGSLCVVVVVDKRERPPPLCEWLYGTTIGGLSSVGRSPTTTKT